LCKIENFHKDFWSQILLYQKLSKVICDQKATISSSQENEFTDQIPGFLRFKCDVVLFCAISEEINVFFFFSSQCLYKNDISLILFLAYDNYYQHIFILKQGMNLIL